MTAAAIFLLALMQTAEDQQMTTGGWAFMLGAWAGIISLAIFCFSKVLRNGRRERPGGADRADKTSGAVG